MDLWFAASSVLLANPFVFSEANYARYILKRYSPSSYILKICWIKPLFSIQMVMKMYLKDTSYRPYILKI
jgi:hypothetical protein